MNTKKKVLQRALLGLPLGITIGFIFTVIFSLVVGDGGYHFGTPALLESMNSELGAIVLQMALSALLGAGFGGASVIWELDDWSLLKQTTVYFLIIGLIMMPIAWFAHWMHHSLLGFLSYFGVYVVIYAIIWVVQYIIWRIKVKKLNEKLK